MNTHKNTNRLITRGLSSILLIAAFVFPALADQTAADKDKPAKPENSAKDDTAKEKPTSKEDAAKDKAEKKVLTVDDYGRWSRIDSATISPDGQWATYAYSPAEGDRTLYLRHIDSDKKPTEIPMGSAPRFSDDSKWLAFTTLPGEEESKKLEKSRKPILRTLKLMNLETKEMTVFEGAVRATFAEGSSVVAISMGRPGARADATGGSDLLLVDLNTLSVRNIGNVGAFQFNEPGELLAYTVDAADQSGNGLYVLELDSGVVRVLDSSNHRYRQLTWNEPGDQIAVLRGAEKKGFVQNENEIVISQDVATRKESTFVYTPADDDSFPDDTVISEFSDLEFSDDGSMVFFGVKEQKEKKDSPKADDERANVDVWHWQDDRVQSVQQRRASRDRRSTYASVLHLEQKKFVQLGDQDLSRVSIVGKGRWAIGVDDTKYRADIAWGVRRSDYYRVNLNDGTRDSITEGLGRPMGTSPDGKHFVYLKEKQLWVYKLDEGKTTKLAAATEDVSFVNEDDDHPYELPSFGIAGWTADGTAVIANHKFDLWHLPFDGTPGTNMTSGVGEEDQIRFRYVRLDPEEETIDTTKPMLLSAYGEWTKKSGYYTLAPEEEPKSLIFEDKRVGRVIKAEKSDRVLLTMQTFEDFPNYWVTDTQFTSPKQITDANPQQAEYHWGRRVLVDYQNEKDVPLQATLTLPGNFEEGKQYPMLVYFYEKMSQRHHEYSMPQFDDRPHMCTYASDGYLVLMPDVVYEIGTPGSSAVDCVTSAVKAVIELGYVDPERIVLQGHSWGGYQSSFILTQTDMFAAVVTGAPVTNLVSFHGELYKSSGTVQQGIMEKGQVRMGVSPWEDMELYRSQSPLHNVENITTPFMILHGTADGAVDWHQGLEYYNAARRNGKEVILLSYPDEGHHLGNKANQIDFQIRMKQFFDHYAKGTEAPDWMKEGVPFLEKEAASPRPPTTQEDD
ncbi:MAG TPA: S9 family peptidase [Planctomycetaceae bacterium]|nr:S9 family peptidase [Planctomycetaceae bacterium]